VLGLAATGTGKTAAFVLPILQRLLQQPLAGPSALVVVPTRELASQVHGEFESLARHTTLSASVVFGGVPIARQERSLRGRPDVVVACPGRLLDLLGRRALRLDRIAVLVLDEADHMFDMGFLPDVRRILAALPTRRQNLLFSATMPPEIRGLADAVLRRPAVIELGHSKPAATIAHALVPLAEHAKQPELEQLFASPDFRSAIVFLRTKRRARFLAQRLEARGHRAIALQGNMSQAQRERALRGFRERRFDVLVATDLAARGLDIANVSHVVNFDVPGTPDAYTHRIGRTGRSGASGQALTFVTAGDASAVRAIERRLGAVIERRNPIGVAPSGARPVNGHRPSSSATGRHRRQEADPASNLPRTRGGPKRNDSGHLPRRRPRGADKGGSSRPRDGHARGSFGTHSSERGSGRGPKRRHGKRQR
jgi:ATP-dependent RNA helicase RhlE